MYHLPLRDAPAFLFCLSFNDTSYVLRRYLTVDRSENKKKKKRGAHSGINGDIARRKCKPERFTIAAKTVVAVPALYTGRTLNFMRRPATYTLRLFRLCTPGNSIARRRETFGSRFLLVSHRGIKIHVSAKKQLKSQRFIAENN